MKETNYNNLYSEPRICRLCQHSSGRICLVEGVGFRAVTNISKSQLYRHTKSTALHGQADSQVDASSRLVLRLFATYSSLRSQRKSTHLFRRLATRRKQSYVREIFFFATCVKLRADLRIRLATLRKSVCKSWFCKLAFTCIDLRVRGLARSLGICNAKRFP